jgi:thiamine transport system ATP-binding protein
MLSVRGVTVRFDEHVALDSVALDIADGEVVSVLGPSGCGKSTLLRAIAGLQPLDAGHISLEGRDLVGVPPHQRGVGLMFQDHALFPHRDVASNIGFGLRMQRRPRAALDARVTELLELVGLSGMGERAIGSLSGGEQQRVALARALAPAPSLLMLDEPLGALDRTLRDRLAGELRRIFRRLGTTVLAVTHDHGEAFALADRLVVMAPSRIAQVGTPGEIWSRPASTFVARFLGFANVAAADIGGGRARTPWGDLPLLGTGTAVLVRPGAVAIAPDGDLEATVIDRTFAGDAVDIVLGIAGAPALEARCAPSAAPPIGASVRVRIDPSGVVDLPS